MARQKNDAAAPEAAGADAADVAETPQGFLAEVQSALKGAVQAGDNAAHGALAALETGIGDLRSLLVAVEREASDDIKAMIAKIKAVL